MIDSIHQSMVSTFLRCGEQFRRRYIEGEIIPPGVAAARGTGLHKANEVNCEQKIHTGVDLPVSVLKDAARDGYVNALKNGVFLAPDEISSKNRIINEALNDAIRLTDLYHDEVAPVIIPIDTERTFFIDAGFPLPLAGRIDVEQKGGIDDLKTTSNAWAEGRIEKEIQPFFYSYAYERERGEKPVFTYHILRALKTKTERQIQYVEATDEHYAALFAKLNIFCRMLELGAFPPADPGSWMCDPNWCGYYRTCKYVHSKRKLFIGGGK